MRRYTLSEKYSVMLKSGTDGYQPKYYRNGYWYKQDVIVGEGKVENIVSHLLRHSSLPKSTYVYYESCIINRKYGCRSKTFLGDNEEFISFDNLYSSFIGGNLSLELSKLGNAQARYNLLLNIGRKFCSLDLSVYFKVIFLIDMLIENTDRHTKNIGVIYNSNLRNFRVAPVFDNGRSLHLGLSLEDTVHAKTISGSFTDQVVTACGFPVKSIFSLNIDSCLKDPTINTNSFLVSQLAKYSYLFSV